MIGISNTYFCYSTYSFIMCATYKNFLILINSKIIVPCNICFHVLSCTNMDVSPCFKVNITVCTEVKILFAMDTNTVGCIDINFASTGHFNPRSTFTISNIDKILTIVHQYLVASSCTQSNQFVLPIDITVVHNKTATA